MSKSYPTRNDLDQRKRGAMTALLNDNLASALDLGLQAKLAHWNAKGPAFFSLHELFDKVHAAAAGWVDTIAERAVQLGGVAEANLETVQQRTRLPTYPLDRSAGRDHLDAIAGSLAVLGTSIRAAIDRADEVGDAGTADLFTEISRGLDEALWLVEAHMQADR